MVTGVETAGIVLAVLPLVVNQLDAYVQGIEALKGFRTRRYRRQFEEYSTRLGTQHAILLNTLEQSLEGLVDYEDEISELISNPRGPLWKDSCFQKKLVRKLDRNYGAFTRTMTELSTLLETLSKKLGLESADPLKISWDDASAVDREIKKFRDIFSKSVYADLLNKIDSANASLKTLLEQSDYRQESRRKHRISKKPLLKYRAVRKHAGNLYNAVVRGKYWKCPCKNSHCVHLRMEPHALDTNDDHDLSLSIPRLRIAFSTTIADSKAMTPWHWEEVETVPVLLDAPSATQKGVSSSHRAVCQRSADDRKVQFATTNVTTTLQSLPWPEVHDVPPELPISDFCSLLLSATGKLRSYLGSISDESDSSCRYSFYLMEKHENSVETLSLEDLLSSSLHPVGSHAARLAFLFTRRDRLFLAATLASSVLQFHGSWLKSCWRSRDILFPKPNGSSKSFVDHPYLSGHEVSKPTTAEPATRTMANALIRSEVLFPLGLVLVELSLCQSISALRMPEDEDTVEAIANFKTASRVLDQVYSESGFRYGDVVNKCLFWSEIRNSTADDEEFQLLVFQNIVSPLVEDLRDFEGKARIR
ncbi:uncharacterized protein Z518_03131 [Rhinocladiella mackenziei CBS 650.93]|uniref:DUF7580 domain-containing protein n=1 Tax=Rhinocladiella mackenziei CBS 650.93 TaxID=1442369 RepID=A0A0D2JGN1_9EURO|nr:uncharacterized protein Z518_03131 [Rhinocladiella mackenziei CBS 650.93]KIX08475.1 hypothetical protein Z518_03131 [Rhinocladiella mackenziei CBS 650.93]